MTDRIKQGADSVERGLVLHAPPEDLWEEIITSGFLAEEVQLELRPGGEATFLSRDEVKNGWVEEAIPPAEDPDGTGRLTFWWGVGEDPATRVELTLEPEGEGHTRLRVVESRPLELLDVVGIPLPGSGGSARGPAMLAAA